MDELNPDTGKKRKANDEGSSDDNQDGGVQQTQSDDHETSPQLHEVYYDQEGDLEIVTSDNVLFKIHAYEFQSASRVFKAMIKDATASRLTLVDEIFEDASTLASLLGILIHGHNYAYFDLPQAFRVAKLARKYEFDRWIALMKLQIELVVEKAQYFGQKSANICLAMALGDYPLCALSMQKAGDAVKMNDWSEEFEGPPVSAWILDPTSLGYDDMQAIPRPVFWAWCRAYCNTMKPRTTTPTQAEADFLSKEFLRLMETPELKGALADSRGSKKKTNQAGK